MLKRQRASSPLSFPPDITTEADVSSSDLYEPDAKRRRYFVPTSSSERPASRDQNDAELSDGSSTPDIWQQERGKSWKKGAGEYSAANSLLHDLHAEQRHRAIFALSPLPSTSTSSPYQSGRTTSPLLHNLSKEYTHVVEDEPLYFPSPSHECTNSSSKCSIPGPMWKQERIPPTIEADQVARRYEDTNR